jgi:2-polyprenyl-3-methyl-5-hydroxy-6-metoxy-1,4-benzoquinol methylase
VLRLELLTREIRSGALRLLDFGCGHGGFVAMCRLYGFDAIGVDRSSAKRSNASVPIVAGLDAVDGPFHAVTLFEVLQHLDDPRGALATLAPRLVRGGVLVLETPDCSGVTAIRTHSDYLKIHPLDHINGFMPQSLRHLAERVGFAPIDRPTAHVTAERLRVARGEVKRVIGGLMRPTTQQYFRKT